MKKLGDEANPGQCMICGKPLGHDSTGYCYYCIRMSRDKDQVLADKLAQKELMNKPTGARHAKE